MTEWPADEVARKAVSSLVPFARNSRIHSDDQIDQVARSITEWGWTNPVLIGAIIAGHARVLAAQKLGLPEVPVIARGLSEAQIRAYVIADNKLAENAGWDNKMLVSELQELSGGFDLSLIGFDKTELDRLLTGTGADADGLDEAPEPPAEPITRPESAQGRLGTTTRTCQATPLESNATLCQALKRQNIDADRPELRR